MPFFLTPQLNGLTCYIITHIIFLSAVYFGVLPVSIIADNWLGLFVAANFMGYFLTVFAYVKAHLFPCHPDDRKFSGSFLYDMFMGIEFNPRIGELWDFKVCVTAPFLFSLLPVLIKSAVVSQR